MNYLEQLGLGDVCEDEDFFMYLMQHTCEMEKYFAATMATTSGIGGLTSSSLTVISSPMAIATG